MAYDPSEPDSIEEANADDSPEIGVEDPEDDTAEQFTEVAPDHDEPVTDAEQKERANEADLIEQARVVTIDEDDYR